MNLDPYIGIPFAEHGRSLAGCDCYGLVWLVLRDVFGQELPDYVTAYSSSNDQASVAQAIRDGLRTAWEPLQAPRTGALVVLKIAGRPWHCGLVVTPELFLHQPDTDLSRIERLNRPAWARRVLGYWWHVGMPSVSETAL